MLKRVLFMGLAILAAAGTFILVNNAKQTAPVQQVQAQIQVVETRGEHILVASESLSAGSFVTQENLRWQLWPEGSAAPSYFNKEEHKIEDLAGAVIRRSISAGEPLTADRLIKPGDRGFVAAILKPGMRAVSVNVNATTGIAGLVFPGDQVDVLLTHAIQQLNDEERPMRQVSETILQNVRVLAMDQKTDDQNSKPSVPKTATLEVTPKQAEILMIGAQLGRLSLSLRALSDIEEFDDEGNKIILSETPTYTLDGEASRLLSANMTTTKVEIVRGAESEQVTLGGSK